MIPHISLLARSVLSEGVLCRPFLGTRVPLHRRSGHGQFRQHDSAPGQCCTAGQYHHPGAPGMTKPKRRASPTLRAKSGNEPGPEKAQGAGIEPATSRDKSSPSPPEGLVPASDSAPSVSFLPLLGVLALLGGGVGFAVSQGFTLADAVSRVEDAVSSSGPLGPAIFIGAYATATVALVPASVLTLAAGYLFGPVAGTAIVSAASTLGASLAFLVSRYAARPFVESRLAANPRFSQIDAGIAADGAKVVFLLRLSPLVPFSLLNYMLGLTRVQFWQYVGASWAGMLPGTVAYVGLGALGGAGVDAAGSGDVDVPKLALYGVGVVATLWATKIISGVASEALADGDKSGKV